MSQMRMSSTSPSKRLSLQTKILVSPNSHHLKLSLRFLFTGCGLVSFEWQHPPGTGDLDFYLVGLFFETDFWVAAFFLLPHKPHGDLRVTKVDLVGQVLSAACSALDLCRKTNGQAPKSTSSSAGTLVCQSCSISPSLYSMSST